VYVCVSVSARASSAGRSGGFAGRFDAGTASARGFSGLIFDIGAGPAVEPIGGWPPGRPATAGPAPLKGTWVMSAFQRTWNRFSAVRCGVVPAPGEANASLSFITCCRSSSRLFAGKEALITMMFACWATTDTAVRSFTGS
jgi:hypothetical protein